MTAGRPGRQRRRRAALLLRRRRTSRRRQQQLNAQIANDLLAHYIAEMQSQLGVTHQPDRAAAGARRQPGN